MSMNSSHALDLHTTPLIHRHHKHLFLNDSLKSPLTSLQPPPSKSKNAMTGKVSSHKSTIVLDPLEQKDFTDLDLRRLRLLSQKRLESTWNDIYQRYSLDFEQDTNIIDFNHDLTTRNDTFLEKLQHDSTPPLDSSEQESADGSDFEPTSEGADSAVLDDSEKDQYAVNFPSSCIHPSGCISDPELLPSSFYGENSPRSPTDSSISPFPLQIIQHGSSPDPIHSMKIKDFQNQQPLSSQEFLSLDPAVENQPSFHNISPLGFIKRSTFLTDTADRSSAKKRRTVVELFPATNPTMMSESRSKAVKPDSATILSDIFL